MLEELLVHFDRVILTRYQDNPRGRSEQELFKLAEEIAEQKRSDGQHVAEFFVEPTPESAWRVVNRDLDLGLVGKPSDEESGKQLVCISGSAFLVAELRKTCIAARIEG
jgi:dihydrofolate synthase/folylpolyglutamate synthase